jgi:hypothetical protein
MIEWNHMAGAEFMCSGKNISSRQLSFLSFLTESLAYFLAGCHAKGVHAEVSALLHSVFLNNDHGTALIGLYTNLVRSQTHEGIDAKTDDSTMQHRRTIYYIKNCTG